MQLNSVFSAPPKSLETDRFYEAAAAGRFMIGHCQSCRRHHWYPRAYCPFCSEAAEMVEGSGKGTIYTYSVMRRVRVPFALAYVSLAEGPNMLTNLVDCDADALAIGKCVRLIFKKAEDGSPIPCFTPD